MFRNSKSFGISDPRFGNDVGFYMFKLPFITFVLDWLFIAIAFVTVLVLATHVLIGRRRGAAAAAEDPHGHQGPPRRAARRCSRSSRPATTGSLATS